MPWGGYTHMHALHRRDEDLVARTHLYLCVYVHTQFLSRYVNNIKTYLPPKKQLSQQIYMNLLQNASHIQKRGLRHALFHQLKYCWFVAQHVRYEDDDEEDVTLAEVKLIKHKVPTKWACAEQISKCRHTLSRFPSADTLWADFQVQTHSEQISHTLSRFPSADTLWADFQVQTHSEQISKCRHTLILVAESDGLVKQSAFVNIFPSTCTCIHTYMYTHVHVYTCKCASCVCQTLVALAVRIYAHP